MWRQGERRVISNGIMLNSPLFVLAKPNNQVKQDDCHLPNTLSLTWLPSDTHYIPPLQSPVNLLKVLLGLSVAKQNILIFSRRGHDIVTILEYNCHNGEFLCLGISYGSSPEIIDFFFIPPFILIVEYLLNSPFCELLAADAAIAINRGCTPTWPTHV